MAAVRLSTLDNPYHPFEQFERWYIWDVTNGYNSCELLDRVARTSNQFSDTENILEIERAIDEIVLTDPTGMRCRVFEGSPAPKLAPTDR